MRSKLLFLLLGFNIIAGSAVSQSNDHIFPASVSAKPFMDMDSHGFIINGKRTFLVSAGLEYARIPRALWRDRLLRLKRCGFNCVEFYTFWNFHEAEEGKFDFSGDHDLNAFLQLVKQMGMYAIARVGPYYCAEWDFGGYPHWLRQKQGMVVRSPDAQFEKYMDRFFSKLIPVIAKNQINHGGSVILVQLENEHPQSWGTYLPNEYFRHLQKTALSLGIEVPYFFSGLHHGSDPAGNAKDLFDASRPNPWFTTEFWSVWYDKYGSDQKDADEYGRRTWKIIAHGGNGYNYYMAYGGTNFGYTNNDEDAASYDYGAAVGQAGDLRPIYYQFKRNALFARSFQSILENSLASSDYNNILSDSTLALSTRASASGDIVFIDNGSDSPKQTQIKADNKLLPSEGALTIEPKEIMPIVHNFSLTNNAAIDWAATRILGIQHSGNTVTLLVYGKENSPSEIWFSLKKNATSLSDKNAFAKEGNQLKLKFRFDVDKPVSYSFSTGDETIRIIAVNNLLADNSWMIDEDSLHCIVIGPQYLGNIKAEGSNIVISTEQFWQQKNTAAHIWLYKGNVQKTTDNNLPAYTHPGQLNFSESWLVKDASMQADIHYNASNWLESENPLQMGADGDTTAYAWYRTSINIPSDGTYYLQAEKGNGRYIVFIDGKKAAAGDIHHLQFQASKGNHLLAVFATHDGRDKLVSYIGKLDIDEKGLAGAVSLHRGASPYIRNWKFVQAKSWNDTSALPSFADASDYKSGDDAFHNRQGFGWFQTTIPNDAGSPDSVLFNSVDDSGIVYINGKRAGSQNGWGKPFTVPFPKTNSGQKENTISVFVKNSDGQGGLGNEIKVIYKNDIRLTGWRMKGGPGDFQNIKDWSAIASGDTIASGKPAFYKNYFTVKNTPGVHAVWRVSFAGLSHGFIWVNGHNLGRYPEKIPINGLYIPECWLKNGKNEIVIFDEYGRLPNLVGIEAEQAASRDESNMEIKL